MDLSISIVSWNVREYLKNCLKSVYDTINNLSFEVIVVDNNSNDGTIQMIKDEFPFVKLIENRKNLGFAAANNQAIRQAKAEYILLLNPDTIILPGTIEGMLRFMDSYPEAGISSCRKIDENANSDILDTLFGKYEPFYFNFYMFFKITILSHLSNLFPNSKLIKKNIFNMNTSNLDFNVCNKNKPVEVDVVWGSFMVIRKDVIKQVGEFDNRFFFTAEDNDFCYRTKRAGWKIYFCPQYEIVHLNEKSITQWSKKDKQNVKTYSLFIFYSKHKGKIWLFLIVFKMIGAKIMARGISLIFHFIFITKGVKRKKEDNGVMDLSSVSIDIINLFKVIFNISPNFKRNLKCLSLR